MMESARYADGPNAKSRSDLEKQNKDAPLGDVDDEGIEG